MNCFRKGYSGRFLAFGGSVEEGLLLKHLSVLEWKPFALVGPFLLLLLFGPIHFKFGKSLRCGLPAENGGVRHALSFAKLIVSIQLHRECRN